ncbi:hypothetical protein MKW92_026111 [Papaver armeniacum]|nr:hypothetical protein MKW92_026111 [Papaver armeniacum]
MPIRAALVVSDLPSVESVCKFLSYTIRSDARLWRDIHIDRTTSRGRITDDALLQLANMAQGNLRTLSLVKCSKITDDGLKHVLERNPRLIKLNVPACTRLTKYTARWIKQVRVGECYDVQQIHFEELKSLIGEDSCRQKSDVKNLRCRFFQMVYDCPTESCQGKKCGRCINDVELEETFCLETLCSSCWNQMKA